MSGKNETLQALTRALIAVAWRDDELSVEEQNVLKDVTFLMPEMTGADWRDLSMYWLAPISAEARAELLEQLRDALQDDEQKRYAYEVFKAMVYLDGEVTDDERAAMEAIITALERLDHTLEPALANLLDSVLEERSGRHAHDLAHQPDPGDFVRNRVYHLMRQRFGKDMEDRLGLDEYELRRLGLAGAVMARVAYADADIDEQEITTIQTILERDWSLHPDHAAVVVDSALDALQYAFDNYRLLREFYEVTLAHERLDFIGILFRIAYAHAGLDQDEAAEIQHIARILKIHDADYHDAYEHASWSLSR